MNIGVLHFWCNDIGRNTHHFPVFLWPISAAAARESVFHTPARNSLPDAVDFQLYSFLLLVNCSYAE